MTKLKYTAKSLLFLAVIILYVNSIAAHSTIQIVTTLETRPELLIDEHFFFLSPAERASLKLVKEPICKSATPRYGKVIIGNSPDESEIVVVIDRKEDETPRVYIDTNVNHDLTDDIDPEWTVNENGMLTSEVRVKATFVVDNTPHTIELPYRCLFSLESSARKCTCPKVTVATRLGGPILMV